MFATLLGGLPRPDLAPRLAAALPGEAVSPGDAATEPGQPGAAGEGDLDELVRIAIAAQADAGLEPVTDGQLRWAGADDLGARFLERARLLEDRRGAVAASPPPGPLTVDAWRFAASCTDRAVKQQLPGPYSLAERLDPARLDRDALAQALAEALRAEILELAAAGCPLVEVEEPEAVRIGTDPERRRRFAEASRTLLDGVEGIHVSLAISGGSADGAGVETILAAPYASVALDLIAGPDNWRLAAALPVDRGIVCGVISSDRIADDGAEAPLWAARYAGSMRGRGLARVGLATASGLEALDWATAVAKITALGRAARIAALPPGEELRRSVDPRAIDIRSAALGSRERVPRPRRPR